MEKVIMTASGTRAIIGENFTPQLAVTIAVAFGNWVSGGVVVVGTDTRTSHAMVKSAVISGLMATGVTVIDIGQVPTPTVQHAIRDHGADGGIVVTASHNPIQWNGLKLMNKTGSFLTASEFDSFMDQYRKETPQLSSWDKIGKITLDHRAIFRHIDRIVANFDISKIRNAGLRVLVDVNAGAGAVATPILLDRLGVSYTILNEAPDGRFAHNPEPVAENLTELITVMGKYCGTPEAYDVGFAQDADADRLVVVDENGRFIGEDYSLGLCVDYLLTDSPPGPVVVNLSTSQVIGHIAARHNCSIIYTKIGESHVTAGIRAHQAVVGGEGNGGVIYPKIGWGRDSLVGIVVVLMGLANRQQTVSQWVSRFPQWTMIRHKVAVKSQAEVNQWIESARGVYPDAIENTLDGLKLSWAHAWMHIRPSNTEPIIRLFVEAPTETEAREILNRVLPAPV